MTTIDPWVRTTNPDGQVRHVAVEEISAVGECLFGDTTIGAVWMRSSTILFYCTLDELRSIRERFGLT